MYLKKGFLNKNIVALVVFFAEVFSQVICFIFQEPQSARGSLPRLNTG